MEYTRLRGIGVSPGIAIGEVQLTERVVFTSRKEDIVPSQVENELKRLCKAIERTKKELIRIRDQIKQKVGEEHAFIFEAHIMILGDKSLRSEIKTSIKEEKCRAEWAISKMHEKYQKIFESIDDEYFRQRKSDVSDVLGKVYRNLAVTKKKKKKKKEDKDKILVAHDLLPSEAVHS